MSILDALYTIMIEPLELFFEVLFMIVNRITDNPGLSIVVLSLSMNFLVLPLYRRADEVQDQERQIEQKLGPGVEHIKKTFSGDERMMILQTYYRQNGYKQSYALRGSMSLLLEVPFFIAAYRFLSGLALLQGVSLGPIADLGAPDALLSFGSFSVNLLPILMTAINIVSGAIYTKGFPLKTKVQLYAMALIFLVFLYQSPAGLVFYWTLNNLFSLVKNIFYKLKNAKKVLSVFAACAGLAAVVYTVFFYRFPSFSRKAGMAGVGIILILLAWKLWNESSDENRVVLSVEETQRATKIYRACGIFLTVLMGVLIPSAIIGASPRDFLNITIVYSPLNYVLKTVLISAGYFLVWAQIFFFLASDRAKTLMARFAVIVSVLGMVDYFFFPPESRCGTLSDFLEYENDFEIYSHRLIINSIAVFVIVLLVFGIYRKIEKWMKDGIVVLTVVMGIMCLLNVISIQQSLATIYYANKPVEFNLSKNGKNVVVIMLDRAIGGLVPYLMQEKPELQAQFEGFTYYPNTLSYGGHTIFAAPALLGGYEYTPYAMNQNGRLLEEQHNEACHVIPVLMERNGYEATVVNPPFAGYQYTPDLGIFEDEPEIKTYLTGGYYNEKLPELVKRDTHARDRIFFCYSFMRCVPLAAQKVAYNEGQYNASPRIAKEYGDNHTTISDVETVGWDTNFLNAYRALQNLEQMTKVTEDDRNTYLFYANDTTHDVTMLQEPEYAPSDHVDNTDVYHNDGARFVFGAQAIHVENYGQRSHYECNMAALLELGKWFDYLRSEGVYDNTRIILVSDHTYTLNMFSDLVMENGEDLMQYNPLLMVKDFDSHEFVTSKEFMTNADVPELSVAGIIEQPQNPYSGEAITSIEKQKGIFYIIDSEKFDPAYNTGKQFPAADWYELTGDEVFDLDTWKQVGINQVMPEE